MAALDAAQMRSWSERRDRAEEDGEGQRFRGGGKVEERRENRRWCGRVSVGRITQVGDWKVGVGGWLLSPVTWPVCAGGVPVSAEAPGRFRPTATFSGHTGVIRG